MAAKNFVGASGGNAKAATNWQCWDDTDTSRDFGNGKTLDKLTGVENEILLKQLCALARLRGVEHRGALMAMIEMTVEGIGIDPQNQPLVLLRDDDRKTFVPIWIGPAEAVSIQMELDNRQPQRPMTHDLIANILRELGVQLVKVTVNDFSDSVYYASLHLQLGNDANNVQEIDARPSDAIALALRTKCQILVSDSVAEKTGIQVEESESEGSEIEGVETVDDDASPEEIDKFMKLMEGVDLGSGEGGKN
jgi:bifunctional DNase/RNase